MMSEARPIILIHLREVMRQSSINGCLPLLPGIVFPGLIWFPNLANLLENEWLLGRKDSVLTIRGSYMLSESLPNHWYTTK